MVNLLFIIVGLVGLWIGTELIIRGATRLARHYGLSETVFGLTVLAVGSDLPELVVAINAAAHTLRGVDQSGIVMGTAIGSLMGQFGLVMGTAGLIGYLTMPERYIIRHGTVLIGATLLLILASLDGHVGRIEGAGLLVLYVIYLIALLLREEKAGNGHARQDEPALRSWVVLAAGFVLLIGNAELTVTAVTALAERFRIDDIVIAVVILGAGSSLPELSLSVSALLKKKGSLSVGNLVGSNVLDTLLVPGLAAIIAPLTVLSDTLVFDFPLLFVLTVLVFVFFWRRKGLQRNEAMVLLGFYLGYILLRASEQGLDAFNGWFGA